MELIWGGNVKKCNGESNKQWYRNVAYESDDKGGGTEAAGVTGRNEGDIVGDAGEVWEKIVIFSDLAIRMAK